MFYFGRLGSWILFCMRYIPFLYCGCPSPGGGGGTHIYVQYRYVPR